MVKKFTWLFVFFSLIEFQSHDAYNNSVTIYPGSEINSIQNNEKPIAIIGDLQRTSILEYFLIREQNDNERAALVNQISKEDISGLIMLGDMVFNGSDKDDWRSFDLLMSPVLNKNIPLFPVLGNHEYWGFNGSAINNFQQRFPRLKKKSWYSINFNELELIILNTNIFDLSDDEWNEQKKWYMEKLYSLNNNPGIKGIIVFTHHPPFTNSLITGDEEFVQENFLPAFYNSPKTLAFISGHAHTYERFSEKNKTFIVSGGGGGPRVFLNSGNNCRKDYYSGPSPRPFNYLLISKDTDGVLVTVKGLKKNTKKCFKLDEFKLNYPVNILAAN